MPALSCVVLGDAALTQGCVEILLERGHRVLGVVTGDGRIAAACAARSLPCRFEPPSVPLSPEAVLELTDGASFDLLFSIHNLRLLSAEVLALPRKLAVNFHDALLPRYAGLHATTWAIFHGETEHGITWHRMTPEIDAGEILVQRAVPVRPDDTAWTLNVRCAEAALAAFPELLDALESDRLAPRPQEKAGRTFFRGGAGRRPAA